MYRSIRSHRKQSHIFGYSAFMSMLNLRGGDITVLLVCSTDPLNAPNRFSNLEYMHYSTTYMQV